MRQVLKQNKLILSYGLSIKGYFIGDEVQSEGIPPQAGLHGHDVVGLESYRLVEVSLGRSELIISYQMQSDGFEFRRQLNHSLRYKENFLTEMSDT
ncbi:hypothetical protein PUN28_006955 [Cardiocondyla obscurior]|uniref:Uncharacterized protein n=1 Tax=Cardiocondyla obscurior TaxID=286306 RepID=A0AAW2G1A1_9HYME